MKRESIISIAAVLLSLISLQLGCKAQDITVDFFEPPPGVIDVGSLPTMCRLTNNTAANIEVYIYGEVSEATDGLIAWGESGSFPLLPGVPHFVTLSDVEPYDYHFVCSNPIYEQSVTVANYIPAGTYTYCAKFINAISGIEFLNTYTCSDPIEATNPVVPELISPADQVTVCSPYQLFSWTPTYPLPLNGSGIIYKMKMVQVYEGESELDAIQKNPSIYEAQFKDQVNYQYQLHDPPLQEEQKYAWQVQALLADGITPYGENNGKTQVFSFSLASASLTPITTNTLKNLKFNILSVSPSGLLYRSPDEPLYLKADAEAENILIQTCNCNGSLASKNIKINTEIHYDWEIIGSNNGTFISRNDLQLGSIVSGQQVLYMPPDIVDFNSKTIEIKLTTKILPISSLTFPGEPFVRSGKIKLKIIREIVENSDFSENQWNEIINPGTIKDHLKYDITFDYSPITGTLPPVETTNNNCTTVTTWKAKNAIGPTSSFQIPEDLAINDLVLLKAPLCKDIDELEISCSSLNTCNSPPLANTFDVPDKLEYIWSADIGTFPKGNIGKNVIWRAPNSECTVNFTLKVSDNNGNQADDTDYEPPSVTREVHKLGICLTKLEPGWKPDLKYFKLNININPLIYMCKGDPKKWVPATDRKKIITLKLTHVSREPGVCMNYPKPTGSYLVAERKYPPDIFFYQPTSDYFLYKESPDINQSCPSYILNNGPSSITTVIEDNPVHFHHFLLAESVKRVSTLSVAIRVEDYGAVGFLSASAKDCVPIPPRELAGDVPCNGSSCDEGDNSIKIPRDDNNNDIADGVSQDKDASGNRVVPNADIDNNPPGAETGDGFTNYQEYRGFIKKSSNTASAHRFHVRTNIYRKDIFIISESYVFPLSYFYNTGLEVHRIIDNSVILYQPGHISLTLTNGYPDGPATNLHSPEINYNNRRHHGGAQYGLFIEKRNLEANFYGVRERDIAAAIADGVFGTPRHTYKVLVDVNQCHNRKVNGVLLDPGNFERATIAHELGHGINIRHHGEFLMERIIPFAFRVTVTPGPGGPTLNQIVRRNGTVIFTFPGNLSYQRKYCINCETSGNTNCVMIYNNTSGFAGSAGDEIFIDMNGNGTRDAGEPDFTYGAVDNDGNPINDAAGNQIILPYFGRWYKYNPLPHTNNRIPNTYCNSNIGDLHNASGGTTPIPSLPAGSASPANDAMRGNCLGQIRIKCW